MMKLVAEERKSAKKIVEACEEDWGIFQVVDHEVNAELISDMTRLAKEFFALPDQEKLRFDMSGGKNGGFIVSSPLKGEAVQDWREIVICFSYPTRTRDYLRWPHKPEGWRPWSCKLSIASFLNPVPEAVVYPLEVRKERSQSWKSQFRSLRCIGAR